MSSERVVIATMQELGFTAAEAKVYVALLKESPATGYELATRAGVPRSAIYGVLSRLENAGLVNAVDQKPARYVALPAAELGTLLETRYEKRIAGLRAALDNVTRARGEPVTWTLHGYAAMIEQATQLISSGKRALYGSLWGREAGRLAGPLEAASRDGVEVILFSFNRLDPRLGTVLSYEIGEHDLEAYWPHKIILVSDDKRALLGGAEEGQDNRAVLTEEPALIEVAVSNLVLDITLLGQRRGLDTKDVVTRLTRLLAPVEELSGQRPGQPKKTK
jgi:sugar-specific transcriptional regulator TrmB